MKKLAKFSAAVFLAIGLASGAGIVTAQAASNSDGQRVVVTVNDQPITNYDVSQRMRLNEALNMARGSDEQKRKDALQDLIDDVIKRSEAKKNQVEPSDKQVDEAVERLAKNMNSTTDSLAKTLQGKGISLSTLKNHIKASISFNWIMTRKLNLKVEVDKAEVDRRYASIMDDPRLKPVEVYELIEVELPVESSAGAMMDQLMYARAIEAQQIIQKYKGCGSLRQATSGVFNVKIGQPVQAEGSRLPAQMKGALNKAGTKSLLGPMRGKGGVQLIAFCGRKSVSPPKPSREVVEELVKNEKYRLQSERVMRDLRRSAFIDHKSASVAQ
ncbi:MAG: SurA N-terminal domain-containing protein [Parvibaculaceae bacterium]